MRTLGEVIRRQAEVRPEKNAFIFEDKRYTFRQFNRRTNSLINALANMGVERGDRVAIMAHNCPQYFEVISIAKGGRIAVPLDYRLTGRELEYLICDSGANTLVLEAEFADVVNSIRPRLKGVKNFICLDDTPSDMLNYEQLIASYPPDEPAVYVDEKDIMVLFYTSGTTGRPKGVIRNHRGLLINAENIANITYKLVPEDVFLCSAPFFHIGGSMFSLLPAFYTGCTTVILKRFDATAVLEAIQKYKVSATFLAPTMIARLIEQPDLHKYDLSSLRLIQYAGSPMPVEILKRAINLFGEVFLQHYGGTENGLVTFLSEEEHKVDESEQSKRILGSIGKPIPGIEVRIVDEEDRDVDIGEVGEIVVRGEIVMDGYWNLPKESAEALRNGWLHTGDLAKMYEDGYICIVDRKNDMIISGGENIYPKEIEEVLYSHPAVAEAAVIGVPDEKWGESVKAIISLKEGMTATEEDIIEHCQKNLAGWKKPKSVEFVDSLPKNPAGKILKNVLREKYWKGYEKRVH